MENTVMISSLLCNILIGCFCIVVLSWAVVAIQTVINDFKREKREEESAARDLKYHEERMQREKEQAEHEREYHEKRMKSLE